MIVCLCHRVSERAIDAAIGAGAQDLAAVGRATGAGTDCGCCRPEIETRLGARATPCSSPPCPGCPRASALADRAA